MSRLGEGEVRGGIGHGVTIEMLFGARIGWEAQLRRGKLAA